MLVGDFAAFPMPPEVVKTRVVKDLLSTSRTRSYTSRFSPSQLLAAHTCYRLFRFTRGVQVCLACGDYLCFQTMT